MIIAILLLAFFSCVAFVVFFCLARRSKFLPQVRLRLKRDWKLLRKCWWRLLLCYAVMTYIQQVGTAFAFIRHRQMVSYVSWDAPRGVDSHNISYISGYMFDHTLENKLVLGNGVHLKVEPRLHDLGFDILPDLSWNSWSTTANDGLQYVFIATTLCVMGATYFLELSGKSATPQVVQIGYRLLWTCTIGMSLRVPIFLSTSLPGPAPHCIGPSVPGKKFEVAIFWMGWMGERNCGDLIFSGHFFLATTMVLNALFYLRKMFSQKVVVIVGFFLLILELAQVHTIILSRSHYTVDIVAGLLMSVYNWISNLYFFPNDVLCDIDEAHHQPPANERSESDSVNAVQGDASMEIHSGVSSRKGSAVGHEPFV